MRCVLAMALLVGSVAVGQELPKDAGVQPPAGPPTLENLLGDVDLPATRRPVVVDGSEPVGIANQRGPLLGTVKRPRAGFQHRDLNRAWAEYDEQIDAVTGFAKDAIEGQFRKATEAGDLDLALKWKSAREQLERLGVVPEGMEVQAAGKSTGAGDRPVLVAVVIQQANGRLAAAYENVEKALVKSLELDQAQVVRAERVRLMTGLPLAPEAQPGVANLNRRPTPPTEGAAAGVPVPGNGNAVGGGDLDVQSVSEITSLTPEQAKRLVTRFPGYLDLPRLTSLSAEVAEVLADPLETGRQAYRNRSRSFRRIRLNGLTEISDEAAQALAQHGGGLELNGLTTLSTEAAKALSHKLKNLNGLTTLSAEAAKALAQGNGALYLNGLTTLSDEVAEALAQHRDALYLNGLTTISAEAAKALAQHKKALHLNGLTTISAEAAKALAQERHELNLNGLTTLSDDVAEALAQCYGGLNLDGVTRLSDDAAKTLAKSRSGLSLKGIVLTPELFDALVKRAGPRPAEVNFDTMKTLSAEQARHLGALIRDGYFDRISLNGLGSISKGVADALIGDLSEGPLVVELHLDGLKELPTDVARALARIEGPLSLNGVLELSPEAAGAFYGHTGGLSLGGLETLSIKTRFWLEQYDRLNPDARCRYDKKLPLPNY